MEFKICVSEIKYCVSCEGNRHFPEFEDYLCPEMSRTETPEAASAGNAREDGADAAVSAAEGLDTGGTQDCVNITLTASDIAAERTGELEKADDRNLFKAALLRKVALESLKRNRLLMHGACIAFDGKGYLFTAPSGTGKTTHIRLWKKLLGEAVTIVNGDKPILRVEPDAAPAPRSASDMPDAPDTRRELRDIAESGITAYGTPWAGKEGWQCNTSVPVAAIVEIVRGTKNSIRRVDKAQAFAYLYQHSFLGEKDPALIRTRMRYVRKIVDAVPFYVLECDMSEKAFACSFEALTGRIPPVR